MSGQVMEQKVMEPVQTKAKNNENKDSVITRKETSTDSVLQECISIFNEAYNEKNKNQVIDDNQQLDYDYNYQSKPMIGEEAFTKEEIEMLVEKLTMDLAHNTEIHELIEMMMTPRRNTYRRKDIGPAIEIKPNIKSELEKSACEKIKNYFKLWLTIHMQDSKKNAEWIQNADKMKIELAMSSEESTKWIKEADALKLKLMMSIVIVATMFGCEHFSDNRLISNSYQDTMDFALQYVTSAQLLDTYQFNSIIYSKIKQHYNASRHPMERICTKEAIQKMKNTIEQFVKETPQNQKDKWLRANWLRLIYRKQNEMLMDKDNLDWSDIDAEILCDEAEEDIRIMNEDNIKAYAGIGSPIPLKRQKRIQSIDEEKETEALRSVNKGESKKMIQNLKQQIDDIEEELMDNMEIGERALAIRKMVEKYCKALEEYQDIMILMICNKTKKDEFKRKLENIKVIILKQMNEMIKDTQMEYQMNAMTRGTYDAIFRKQKEWFIQLRTTPIQAVKELNGKYGEKGIAWWSPQIINKWYIDGSISKMKGYWDMNKGDKNKTVYYRNGIKWYNKKERKLKGVYDMLIGIGKSRTSKLWMESNENDKIENKLKREKIQVEMMKVLDEQIPYLNIDEEAENNLMYNIQVKCYRFMTKVTAILDKICHDKKIDQRVIATMVISKLQGIVNDRMTNRGTIYDQEEIISYLFEYLIRGYMGKENNKELKQMVMEEAENKLKTCNNFTQIREIEFDIHCYNTIVDVLDSSNERSENYIHEEDLMNKIKSQLKSINKWNIIRNYCKNANISLYGIKYGKFRLLVRTNIWNGKASTGYIIGPKYMIGMKRNVMKTNANHGRTSNYPTNKPEQKYSGSNYNKNKTKYGNNNYNKNNNNENVNTLNKYYKYNNKNNNTDTRTPVNKRRHRYQRKFTS